MLTAIVESGPIERGNIVTTAGWDIPILANLTVILPTAFTSDIGKKHVLRLIFIQNPQGTS